MKIHETAEIVYRLGEEIRSRGKTLKQANLVYVCRGNRDVIYVSIAGGPADFRLVYTRNNIVDLYQTHYPPADVEDAEPYEEFQVCLAAGGRSVEGFAREIALQILKLI